MRDLGSFSLFVSLSIHSVLCVALEQLQYSDLVPSAIDLVKELSRLTYKAGPMACKLLAAVVMISSCLGPYPVAFRVSAAERAISWLWQLVQDGSGASLEIVQHAQVEFTSCIPLIRRRQHIQCSDVFQAKLEEILSEFTHRTHRVPYLQKCVGNIKEHKSVPQSLDLMRKILGTVRVEC